MTTLGARFTSGSLLATILLAVSGSWAKPPPSEEDRRQAIVHFKLGNQAFERGQLEEARAEYQRAWSLANTFDIGCNLGRTEAELGQHRDAAEHLAYCLDNFSASARPEMRAAEGKLKQVFAEVKQHVAEVVLRVEPDGAQVRVDDKLLGKAPLRRNLYLEPGEHLIDVRMVGHRSVQRRLPTVSGGRQELMLTLEPLESPAQPVAAGSPPPPDDGQAPSEPIDDGGSEGLGVTSRTIALASGSALTAVGLGVGVGFWLQSRKLEDDRERLQSRAEENVGPNGCAGGNTDSVCRELKNAAHDRDDARTVAGVGLASAGLFALTTVASYLWWPDGAGNADTADTASPRIGLLPIMGPEGLGVGVWGTL